MAELHDDLPFEIAALRAQVADLQARIAEAEARGANAVVAMRFDASSIGETWTEVCAYGTAVVVTPIPAGERGATPQLKTP